MNPLLSRLFLLALLVVGLLLRLYNIDARGISGDEKYSLFVSQFITPEGSNQQQSVRKPNSPYFTPREFWAEKSYKDFELAIASIDTGNGAFYTLPLHYWTQAFGTGDASLRMIPLIFSVLTILLIFVFVKTHFKDERMALIAAFLATISPFLITYGQIARNYSILFFLSLWATHVFLIIINRAKSDKPYLQWLGGYTLLALACELCHIATFPLFFVHGLYLLFFYRNFRFWMAWGGTMVIVLISMLAWLSSDGGRYLFDYVGNSVKSYNLMANNNPTQYLRPATWFNVADQFKHVLSAMIFTADGLYRELQGFKNIIIAAITSMGLIVLGRMSLSMLIKNTVSMVLLVISFMLFSVSAWYFLSLILSVLLIDSFLMAWKKSSASEQPLVSFLILLFLLPMVFLVVFTFKDGNTFRVNPRYVGYAYAFGLVLLSWVMAKVSRTNDSLKYIIGGLMILQLGLVVKHISQIYEDTQPRYYAEHQTPRIANPYKTIATAVLKQYIAGDTVIYPSLRELTPSEKSLPSHSVVDAQLVNMYLPKDSDLIQRVEPNETDKVWLKKSNGQKFLIFNFENSKYRH